MPTPTPTPAPVLAPGRLYWGDNGRVTCEAIRCAGQTARYTGRTLEGHAADALTPYEIAELRRFGLRGCECGAVTLPGADR